MQGNDIFAILDFDPDNFYRLENSSPVALLSFHWILMLPLCVRIFCFDMLFFVVPFLILQSSRYIYIFEAILE